ALVRHIRQRGALKGVLSTRDLNDSSLVAKANASPGLVGRDLVKEVVPAAAQEWVQPLSEWARLPGAGEKECGPSSPHVVALDYGMKWNIPRHLCQLGCRVTVLPGTATAQQVLAHEPDGVFLSNGP